MQRLNLHSTLLTTAALFCVQFLHYTCVVSMELITDLPTELIEKICQYSVKSTNNSRYTLPIIDEGSTFIDIKVSETIVTLDNNFDFLGDLHLVSKTFYMTTTELEKKLLKNVWQKFAEVKFISEKLETFVLVPGSKNGRFIVLNNPQSISDITDQSEKVWISLYKDYAVDRAAAFNKPIVIENLARKKFCLEGWLNLSTDKKDMCPLHRAVQCGSLEAFKALTCHIDKHKEKYCNLWHYAVANNNTHFFPYLAPLVKHMSISFSGKSPLQLALSQSKSSNDVALTVEALISQGDNPNVQGAGRMLLLHEAIKKHGFAVTQALLSSALIEIDAQDYKGNTGLHYAVKHDDNACLSLLLIKGANPRIKNAQGRTPLDCAIRKNSSYGMSELSNYQAKSYSLAKDTCIIS